MNNLHNNYFTLQTVDYIIITLTISYDMIQYLCEIQE